MEIIEETTANWLARRDDGSIDNIGKSPQNRALIDHDLWGLVRDGDEILIINDDEHPEVRIIPVDGAKSYQVHVGDVDRLHFGPHLKSDLIDAIVESRERDPPSGSSTSDPRPIINLFDDVRSDRVRTEVVEKLAEASPFEEYVEVGPDGWHIHDHLLLTWERDFYHPDTTTYNRSGSVVSEGASEPAYEVDVLDRQQDPEDREVTLDGVTYRLTAAEMEFVAKALWALRNAPGEV